MAEFQYGVVGNPGSRGKLRGRNVTSYLKDVLEEQDKDTGQLKTKLIAQRLVEIALDKKTPTRDFLAVAHEILNRLEGKPVETSLNANMEIANPFADVPTATLERLKERLAQEQTAIEAEKVRELEKPL